MDRELRDHIRASRDLIIRARVRYTDNAKCLHVQTLKDAGRFGEIPNVYTRPFRVTSEPMETYK